jgi:uncharacterized glyoxalase superfamily protein PhnB
VQIVHFRKEHAMEHPTVFPTLRYADAAAAIEFLVDAFGATRHAVHAGSEGAIVHAELRLGNGMVMLGSPGADRPATGGRGEVIYVVVEDPDAHCAQARRAGATIVREAHDTDYGSREYAAADPEGNEWSFGTYQPFAYEPETEQAGAAAG